MARPGPTTTITVHHNQSPTQSSHSEDDTGIQIRSALVNPESDRLGSSWDGISESDIGSSETDAIPHRPRPHPAAPSPRRHPSREHSRPPSAPSVPRQSSPNPSSTIDISDDFPNTGRSYPQPSAPAYGGGGSSRVPAPGGPPSFMSGYGPNQYAGPGGQMIPTFGAQHSYPPYQPNPFGPTSAPGVPGYPPPQGYGHPGSMPPYSNQDMAHYNQATAAAYGYPQGNHGYGMPTQHMGAQVMPPYNIPPNFMPYMNTANPSATPPPPANNADPEKDKQIEALNKQLEEHKAEKLKAQKDIEEQEAARKKAVADAEAKAEAEKKAAEEFAKFKAKAEADAREKVEAEVKAKAMAEAAKAEADRKAAEELATFKVKVEADAKEKAEAAIKAKKAAEEAKAEADKKAAEEMALFRAKAEIEAREKAEAAIKAKAAADAAAAAEAAAKAKAEDDAKKLIEMQAKIDADQKALDELRAKNTDKKKPIHFKDALNRKFSFPFEICATWDGMESLIRQAFDHVDILGPLVATRQYDLVGPNDQIILPQIWETMIEPDLSIHMRMWPMPPEPKPTEHLPTVPNFRGGHGRGGHGRGGHGRPAPAGRDRAPPPPPEFSNQQSGARIPANIEVVSSRKKAKPAGKGLKKADDGLCRVM